MTVTDTSLSGYSSALPDDVLFGTGVLFKGTTPISASRGGLNFDPGNVMKQVTYDGQTSPVKGLDRKVYMEPKITGSLLQFANAEMDKYEPGATIEVAHAKKGTPKGANLLFATGDYVADLRLYFERGKNGGLICIYFPYALCVKYSLKGQDKDEALVEVEFQARRDASAIGEGGAPWFWREVSAVS